MQAADLGVRMAVMMSLCTYGGYRLDQWLQTQPLFILVGSFLGLGGGMWTVVRSVNKLLESDRTRRSSGSSKGKGKHDDSKG